MGTILIVSTLALSTTLFDYDVSMRSMPFLFFQNHMHRSETTLPRISDDFFSLPDGIKKIRRLRVSRSPLPVGHERYDELAHDRTDGWKRSNWDRSVATWHTKDRMVGGTRVLFREASSTEASSSLGVGSDHKRFDGKPAAGP